MTVVTFDRQRYEIPCKPCLDVDQLFRRAILALDKAGIAFETVKIIQILPLAFIQCQGKWTIHRH